MSPAALQLLFRNFSSLRSAFDDYSEATLVFTQQNHEVFMKEVRHFGLF
jgi:hypothetical protein